VGVLLFANPADRFSPPLSHLPIALILLCYDLAKARPPLSKISVIGFCRKIFTPAATSAFYEQLAASDKEAVHIVIADGAGFHLEEGHELLPKNLRIITLPPYNPELNPIGQISGIVKDRICNRVW
jgi:hypothetical protein